MIRGRWSGKRKKPRKAPVPAQNKERMTICNEFLALTDKYHTVSRIPKDKIRKFESKNNVLIDSIHLEHEYEYGRRTPAVKYTRLINDKQLARTWRIRFLTDENQPSLPKE